MATRFGGSRPGQAYAAKMKWIALFLVTILLLLAVVAFLLLRDPDANTAVVQETEQAESSDVADTVKVLYANQRIEEGVQLSEAMFREQEVMTEQVPEGALKASEKVGIMGQWTKNIISANLPILKDNLTAERPISSLPIPANHRAVTIKIDPISGVDYFVQPNDRVDVLLTHTDRKTRDSQVVTVVESVKVLAVHGRTGKGQKDGSQQNGQTKQTTATLLLVKRDAQRLELARSMGKLSLLLVGKTTNVDDEGETEDQDDGFQTVTKSDILQGTKAEVEGQKVEENDGVMYVRDPKTGKNVRYILVKNKWKKDPEF